MISKESGKDKNPLGFKKSHQLTTGH